VHPSSILAASIGIVLAFLVVRFVARLLIRLVVLLIAVPLLVLALFHGLDLQQLDVFR
jgi:hypothetical protein